MKKDEPAGETAQLKSNRELWVDSCKGLTIALVVVHHAYLFAAPLTGASTTWVSLDVVLTELRMPAFFLVAGLFARKAVAAGGAALWRDRVGKFAYLYVLWSLLYFLLYWLEVEVSGEAVAGNLRGHAWDLVAGLSPMWFIAALAGFFAMTRWLRRVPSSLLIFAAFLVALLIRLTGVPYPLEKMWLFVFFLLGCYEGVAIRLLAQRFLLGAALGSKVCLPFWWTGSRTLPILLLHVPILSILNLFSSVRLVLSNFNASIALVLLTLTSIAGSVLLWRYLRNVPGLFELPPALANIGLRSRT